MASVLVEFESIVKETDNAICVVHEDQGELWIPFSQIDRIIRHADKRVSVSYSLWLARKQEVAE